MCKIKTKMLIFACLEKQNPDLDPAQTPESRSCGEDWADFSFYTMTSLIEDKSKPFWNHVGEEPPLDLIISGFQPGPSRQVWRASMKSYKPQ